MTATSRPGTSVARRAAGLRWVIVSIRSWTTSWTSGTPRTPDGLHIAYATLGDDGRARGRFTRCGVSSDRASGNQGGGRSWRGGRTRCRTTSSARWDRKRLETKGRCRRRRHHHGGTRDPPSRVPNSPHSQASLSCRRSAWSAPWSIRARAHRRNAGHDHWPP